MSTPHAHAISTSCFRLCTQLRGTSAEGKPYYSDELVPEHGTRAEGMKALRENAAAYFPHIWKHVLLQRGIACHEANKDAVTATRRADYAAQIKTLRFSSATCAHPETHNMLVAVMGYLIARRPYRDSKKTR